ncbi:AMP-binding protein [Actinokineospora soli]|uniref:AMP-binding protein n=1 Tax=Actinokineospora soli TaxID=1048753 RepID=A0ABW2TIK4_9PSEU
MTTTGLWFHEHLDPDNPVAHVSAYRVDGSLDVALLRSAWAGIAKTHGAALVVADVRGEARVVDADEVDPSCFTDHGAVPGPVAEWCAGLPLPRLTGGPLVRVDVCALDGGGHGLRVAVHAAVADSASALLADLAAAYAGQEPGPGLIRPEWTEESLAWWVERLTPVPPAVDLPTDRARPAEPSNAGAAVAFEWAGMALRDPEAELLAGLQALLWHYTGSDRFCVAVARPGVVLSTADMTFGPTFGELATAAADDLAASAPHGAVPYDAIVATVNPPRDPRRTPLCDVLLACDTTADPVFPGAALTRLPVAPTATADLALRVTRADDDVVAGTLEYRTSLFGAASARGVLDQLHTLLTAALVEPDRPVADLPLDTPARVAATVHALDAATDAPAPTARVNETVRERAASTPDAPAISWEGREIGYRELADLAAAVTAALSGAAGSAVAVRMPTGPRLVAALQGVLDAGAHLVCLGQADVGERGRAILADVLPSRLLVDGPQSDDLAAWFTTDLVGDVIDVADLPTGKPPAVRGDLRERAYVTYTSGSTGAPKGIAQNHATFAQFTGWFAEEFGIGPGARVAQWAAPGYDAGLVEVFATLAAGATLCPVPDKLRANPDKLAGWLGDERITVLQTVPSFARPLLRALAETGGLARLDGLACLLLAGEALPGDLVAEIRAALPHVRLVNLYGPTEAILATRHEVTEPVVGVAPVGRSIPGRHVLVVGADGRPRPRGTTGEIVIRGPYLADGYLNADAGAAFDAIPALAEHGVDASRCYRTGDLGRLRFDGALEFAGRRDHQVKFNGVRLELADIEAALAAHESVAECAVVAVRGDDGLVARLVGFVVPRRDPDGRATGGASTWRTALRTRFGRGMPPVAFETVLGLPRTVGGKVDRRRLPVPVPSGPPVPSAAFPAVAELWAELLPSADIDPTTGFFAAGGHSALAMRMLAELRARIGVDVPLRTFLADPTPAGVSAAVEARSLSLDTATQPPTG